ncbi:MAG: hypothetical protein M3529_13890, partial [Actinomycetota bacterium]|nr:hypothetical protein [Actinomycetota bacterium]
MFESITVGVLPQCDPAVLSDVDRVDAIVARERLIARLQAEQAELVAAHADSVGPVGGVRGG